MKGAVHICTFSASVGEMKKGDQRYADKVLAVLAKEGRFSVFEATENDVIAKTMTWLLEQGYIEVDNSMGFPWSEAKVTEKGRRLLHDHPRHRNDGPSET
jgi:hypothetical protein